MANTIIQADAPDGLTLTLKLYAVNGDTIQNGASGDTLTEKTNNKGTYTATLTEALVGVHEARITNASDQSIGKYVTEVLVDDTGTYECVDRIDASGIAAAPTAVANRQEMDSNSTQLAAIVLDTAEIGTAGAGLTNVTLANDLSATMKTSVQTAVDAAIDTAISELSVAAPTATPTLRTGLMLLYMALRNKLVVQTSGTDALEVYNDAGTKIASKAITDDGSDYTEAEMA